MGGLTGPAAEISIGNVVSGGTPGSVLFVGAGGVLAEDNANLFWDDVNQRLGIGTNAPAVGLHKSGILSYIIYDNYQDSATFVSRRANGTPAIPLTVTAGQQLFGFDARGHDGTTFSGTQAAIACVTSENWAVGAHGTQIEFNTTANGTVIQTRRLIIRNDGDIQFSNPLIALGGGAVATLGTIGGAGPTVAAQNTWKQFRDTAGAAFWVPVWK